MEIHDASEILSQQHYGVPHGSVCTLEQANRLAAYCVDSPRLWMHRIVAAVLLGPFWFLTLLSCLVLYDPSSAFVLGPVLTFTYDKVARIWGSPSLRLLLCGRTPKTLKWPSPSEMQQAIGMPDHLSLGLTRFALRDALRELLHNYCRDDTHPWQLQWLKQEQPQRPLTSYDLIARIQLELEKRGLQHYSLAQIMYVGGHPGVSKATAFVSHRQDEEILETGAAMREYAKSCWKEPVFWIDVTSLKQMVPGDFNFARIKRCIQDIGDTVMVTQRHGNVPKAVERIFCIFEVYATTCSNATGRPARFHIAASSARPRLCVTKDFEIKVSVETAESRDDQAKEMILNELRRDPGLAAANKACATAIAQGDAMYIRSCWRSVIWALLVMQFIFASVLGPWWYQEGGTHSALVDCLSLCVLLACSLEDMATLVASRRVHKSLCVAHGILFALLIFGSLHLSSIGTYGTLSWCGDAEGQENCSDWALDQRRFIAFIAVLVWSQAGFQQMAVQRIEVVALASIALAFVFSLWTSP